MFLSLTTIRGHQYLYLIESVHVPGRGSVRKIRKSYGRWDKLPAEIRQAYEDERSRKRLAAAMEQAYREETLNKVMQQVDPQPDPAARTGRSSETRSQSADIMLPPLFYGHLALRPIWVQDLDLRKCLYDLQRNKTVMESWSFNELLFYLCSRLAVEPASGLEAYYDKGNYFYCPWHNVTRDNFYRGLDFLYENCETIVFHAVQYCLGVRKSTVGTVFLLCSSLVLPASAGGSEAEARVILALDQSGLPLCCRVLTGREDAGQKVEQLRQNLQVKYQVQDFYLAAERGLNWAQEAAQAAGCSSLVYPLPEDAAQAGSDPKLPASFRQLPGIAEIFRKMLRRPVLPFTPGRLMEQITAHCFLSLLALLMLRQLQFRLHEAGVEMTEERLRDTLRSAVLVPVPPKTGSSGDDYLLLLNVGLNSAFSAACAAGQGGSAQEPGPVEQTEDADALWADYLKALQDGRANSFAAVLRAVGLRPLPAMVSLREAKNRLGLKSYSNDMVCDLTLRLLHLIAGE